jgi:hypothetical protein
MEELNLIANQIAEQAQQKAVAEVLRDKAA